MAKRRIRGRSTKARHPSAATVVDDPPDEMNEELDRKAIDSDGGETAKDEGGAMKIDTEESGDGGDVDGRDAVASNGDDAASPASERADRDAAEEDEEPSLDARGDGDEPEVDLVVHLDALADDDEAARSEVSSTGSASRRSLWSKDRNPSPENGLGGERTAAADDAAAGSSDSDEADTDSPVTEKGSTVKAGSAKGSTAKAGSAKGSAAKSTADRTETAASDKAEKSASERTEKAAADRAEKPASDRAEKPASDKAEKPASDKTDKGSADKAAGSEKVQGAGNASTGKAAGRSKGSRSASSQAQRRRQSASKQDEPGSGRTSSSRAKERSSAASGDQPTGGQAAPSKSGQESRSSRSQTAAKKAAASTAQKPGADTGRSTRKTNGTVGGAAAGESGTRDASRTRKAAGTTGDSTSNRAESTPPDTRRARTGDRSPRRTARSRDRLFADDAPAELQKSTPEADTTEQVVTNVTDQRAPAQERPTDDRRSGRLWSSRSRRPVQSNDVAGSSAAATRATESHATGSRASGSHAPTSGATEANADYTDWALLEEANADYGTNGHRSSTNGHGGVTTERVVRSARLTIGQRRVISAVVLTLALMLNAAAIGYIFAERQPDVWGAEAEIVLQPSDSQIDRFLATQVVLAQSGMVLEAAAAELPVDREYIEEELAVFPIDSSVAIAVKFADEDPDLALGVVGAVVGAYLGEVQTETTSTARAVYLTRIEELRTSRAQIEVDLARVESENASAEALGLTLPNPTEERRLALESAQLLEQIAGLEEQLLVTDIQILNESEAAVVSPPELLDQRVSPQPITYAALGALLGGVIAAAVIFLVAQTRTRSVQDG